MAKKLLEDTSLETKTDLVLDTISEGIITLLRKYPEQKHKLHVFFNQPIPQPLRLLSWQLYFSNLKRRQIQTIKQSHFITDLSTNLCHHKDRKEFMHKLTSAPKLCLSPIDSEIQIKCDHLLKTDMFKSLLESKGFFQTLNGKKNRWVVL